MSTTEPPLCPTCGGSLAADAPEGLCAKCVLGVMLGITEADEVDFEEDDDEAILLQATGLGEIGDYEILEKIAAGGMGVVYRARQKKMGRLVALKLIAEGKLAADTDKERFLMEAQAAGELDHPNIVPIYEVGEDDGQYFFSMRLVTGGSLSDWLERHAVTEKGKSTLSTSFRDRQTEAVKMIRKIALAVHHAHTHGILHRDLKPANILIDRQGEPQVSDFGLAKRVEEDTHLTASGQLLGSPAYMSPEQAAGKNHDLTPAADTYAIGAMLYQALAGRIPFDGESPMALLQETLTKEPKPLRKWNPRIDRDLEVITLCCLEKVPEDRYSSANALAEDLERWLDGRPIQAKPVGLVRRGVKWVHRKPALAAVAVIALAAVLVIVGLTLAFQRVEEARSLADYPEDMRLAHEHLEKHEYGQTLAILEKQAPEDREFVWDWLWARASQVPMLDLGRDAIHALLPSRVNPGEVLLHGPSGRVRSWDFERSLLKEAFQGQEPPGRERLHFDGGGSFLITESEGDVLRLVLPRDKPKGGKLSAKLVPGAGGFLAAAPGERPSLFVQTNGRRGDHVMTWAPPWREGIPRFQLSDDLQALAVSPRSQQQGLHYVAACFRSKIELWQWEEDVFFHQDTIRRPPSPSAAMSFSPNGRLVLVGDAEGIVRGWNRKSLGEVLTKQHVGEIVALTALDRQGVHHVVASNRAGQMRAWPMVRDVHNVPNVVNSATPPIGFSPDGKSLVCLTEDQGRVRVRSLQGATGGDLESPWSRDSAIVALTLIEEAPPVALAILRSEAGALSAVRLSEQGSMPVLESALAEVETDWLDQWTVGHRWFVLGNGRKSQVMDLVSGQIETVERPSELSPKKERIFGRGSALWSIMEGNLVTLWGLPEGKRRVELGNPSPGRHLAVSPDGKTLAVAHADGRLRFWHGESGHLLVDLASSAWDSLAFSPDGKAFVAHESSGRFHIWNTQAAPKKK